MHNWFVKNENLSQIKSKQKFITENLNWLLFINMITKIAMRFHNIMWHGQEIVALELLKLPIHPLSNICSTNVSNCRGDLKF